MQKEGTNGRLDFYSNDNIALLNHAVDGMGKLGIGRLIEHLQMSMFSQQIKHSRALDACSIPGQS